MPGALRWSWGGGQFLMSEVPLQAGLAAAGVPVERVTLENSFHHKSMPLSLSFSLCLSLSLSLSRSRPLSLSLEGLVT